MCFQVIDRTLKPTKSWKKSLPRNFWARRRQGNWSALKDKGVLTISKIFRPQHHKDLTVVWLDVTNAYCSIPHSLMQYALTHYHLPERVKNRVSCYYSNLLFWFSTKDFTAKCIRVERGIITGCTISVILFVLGMNLLLKAALEETRVSIITSGIRAPSKRGYMDDITITTQSHIQARWIVSSLEDTIPCTGMRLKPKKSRSLITGRDMTLRNVPYNTRRSIENNPVKCLGNLFVANLTDKESIGGLKE